MTKNCDKGDTFLIRSAYSTGDGSHVVRDTLHLTKTTIISAMELESKKGDSVEIAHKANERAIRRELFSDTVDAWRELEQHLYMTVLDVVTLDKIRAFTSHMEGLLHASSDHRC